MTGPRVEKADFVCGDEHETSFVQATSSGATEHLQNLIRAQWLFHGITTIRFTSESDATEREVDPCRQTHRGDDYAKLSGFGKRFNDTGARGIAQSAVVIGDTA